MIFDISRYSHIPRMKDCADFFLLPYILTQKSRLMRRKREQVVSSVSESSSDVDSSSESELEVTLNILERQPRITAGKN